MTKKQTEKEEAAAKLREWFPKGSKVYTILRHVSRSGMQREIGLVALVVDEEGEPRKVSALHPNYAASTVLGWPKSKQRDGIKVSGCGMDMGFHLVYELAHALYGNGYDLKHEWL